MVKIVAFVRNGFLESHHFQVKPTEYSFTLVLFCMLYKLVQTFEILCLTSQMKATEQYSVFYGTAFYAVDVGPVLVILKHNHSNENY